MRMILFRAVTNEELINRIKKNYTFTSATIKGNNTFKYEPNIEYLHFLGLQNMLFIIKKQKRCVAVLECIIPDEIIEQYGFGFYGDIKTYKNDALAGWYIPLPEYIIKAENFNIDKVTKILLSIDLNKGILLYFENNKDELFKLIDEKEKSKDTYNIKFKQKVLNIFNR